MFAGFFSKIILHYDSGGKRTVGEGSVGATATFTLSLLNVSCLIQTLLQVLLMRFFRTMLVYNDVKCVQNGCK